MNQAAIGSYIARKRKEKNLTQEQLAEHIGASNKTVSKWENGKRMPDCSILQKLCNVLHVTLPERMDGEDATEGGVRFYDDEQILDLLRRINRELNVTLVIITHSLSVARNICDRVAMIDGGRIVEMGDTEELFSNPQSDILKTLITDAKVENHRHKHDSASSDEQTDAPTKEEVK